MSKFSNSSLLQAGERVTDEQLANEAKIVGFNRSIKLLNRRNFVTTLAATAGAAGALGMTGCSNDGSVPLNVYNPSVLEVLNFALNLEYLEASFYSYVVNGGGLSSTDLGSGAGTVSGGAKISFTNSDVSNVAQNLAVEETSHVEFLRSTITSLGATPVSCPNLNLAAMGTPTTDATFLALARQLEAVGVSAYIGGAQYLVSSTAGLTYAAQILDVEAQHAGALRELCIRYGVTSSAVDSLDTPPTSSTVFNTSSSTGLNPVRTISQVLQIVYGAGGQTGIRGGGFFPQGMSGDITTT